MVDLKYRGKGIEVKSSSYLQSWNQKLYLMCQKNSLGIQKLIKMEKDRVEVRIASCFVYTLKRILKK